MADESSRPRPGVYRHVVTEEPERSSGPERRGDERPSRAPAPSVPAPARSAPPSTPLARVRTVRADLVAREERRAFVDPRAEPDESPPPRVERPLAAAPRSSSIPAPRSSSPERVPTARPPAPSIPPARASSAPPARGEEARPVRPPAEPPITFELAVDPRRVARSAPPSSRPAPPLAPAPPSSRPASPPAPARALDASPPVASTLLPSSPAEPAPSPSPPEPAPAVVDERAQRALLADFTKSLVSSMNRKTYYEPGHPKYFVLRDELFEKLVAVMGEQTQVGYMVERATVPTIWVDGVGMGRCKLSDVLVGSTYDVFAPRFVDYFDRFGLVLLSFRQGITREEFGLFVDLVTQQQKGDRDTELSEQLAKANVLGIASISNKELEVVDGALPWQVRVCIARLTRDLRTVPLYSKRSTTELVRIKELLIGDVVRPLVDPADVRVLVDAAPRIEAKLAVVPELAGLKLADTVVKVLWPPRLVGLVEALLDDVVAARAAGRDASESVRTGLLRAVERLIVEEVPDSERVLRKLYDAKVVKLEQLPPELQEWILAEVTFDARVRGDRSKLPLGTKKERRVAVKVARLAVLRERYEDTLEILDQFRAILGAGDAERARDANEALDQMLTERDVDRIVGKIEDDPAALDERRLLRALGRFAAPALVKHVVAAGKDAAFGASFDLLDQMPAEAMPTVARALAGTPMQPAAARVLLQLAANHADVEAADAAVRFVRHPDASTRLAALAAVLSVRHPEERAVLDRALSDANAEVVKAARKALVERHAAYDELTEVFVRVLAKAEPESSPAHLVVALDHVRERPSLVPAERAEILAAIEHVASVRPPTRKGVLSRADSDEVAVAVERARAAFGVEATKRSSWLGWLKR